MPITRRQFIKRSGVVSAGSLLGPGLWNNLFVRRALAAPLADRYLVVIFLDGGNDGLNTVVPVTNGTIGTLRTRYEAVRLTGGGGLQLSPGALANTNIGVDASGSQLALHPGFYNGDNSSPAFGGLKALHDLDKVAVIQGCGYPAYNLSHEQSRTIWQTGNPLNAGGYFGGWVGRYLALNYDSGDIPGFTVSDSVAAELRNTTTNVLAVQRLQNFAFPYDCPYDGGGYDCDDPFPDPDRTAKRTAFDLLCGLASGGSQSSFAYLGDSGKATLTATESYPLLHDLYRNSPGSHYDDYGAVLNIDLGNGRIRTNGTARNLREVAKVIYGVENGLPVSNPVSARLFQLANGGYDTHSDQGAGGLNDEHYLLHREVSDALKVFYDDLVHMGVANKTLVLIWSEFSRRIVQNANGTDHGSQGPMFVIGGAVNGGVYGKHPNINASALDGDGNTRYTQTAGADFRSTDFRDVYGTVLKHWLGMTDAEILTNVLPLDGGTPANRWTVYNFDLGFL